MLILPGRKLVLEEIQGRQREKAAQEAERAKKSRDALASLMRHSRDITEKSSFEDAQDALGHKPEFKAVRRLHPLHALLGVCPQLPGLCGVTGRSVDGPCRLEPVMKLWDARHQQHTGAREPGCRGPLRHVLAAGEGRGCEGGAGRSAGSAGCQGGVPQVQAFPGRGPGQAQEAAQEGPQGGQAPLQEVGLRTACAACSSSHRARPGRPVLWSITPILDSGSQVVCFSQACVPQTFYKHAASRSSSTAFWL